MKAPGGADLAQWRRGRPHRQPASGLVESRSPRWTPRRLQDSRGAVLAHGGEIHDARAVPLTKGSYTVSLLLRHPDPATLQERSAMISASSRPDLAPASS